MVMAVAEKIEKIISKNANKKTEIVLAYFLNLIIINIPPQSFSDFIISRRVCLVNTTKTDT